MEATQNTEVKPDKAPSTETADGSAVGLKAVGQIQITIGWIVGAIFTAFGIVLCQEDWTVFLGVICFLLAITSIWRGYAAGARAKATAVAAINAKKAAERSARMEQMIINMVGGNGQVVAAPTAAQVACHKCGAKIPANTKFCPECGAPAK